MELSKEVQKIYETILQIDPLFVARNTTDILEKAKSSNIEIIRNSTGSIIASRYIMLGRHKRTDPTTLSKSKKAEGKFKDRGPT